MRIVCDELSGVDYKWLKIGVQLGIPRSMLMIFKREDDPLVAAIDYWLNGNVEDVPLSWKSVVTALNSKHVGEPGLAKKISKKYCNSVEKKGKSNIPKPVPRPQKPKPTKLSPSLISSSVSDRSSFPEFLVLKEHVNDQLPIILKRNPDFMNILAKKAAQEKLVPKTVNEILESIDPSVSPYLILRFLMSYVHSNYKLYQGWQNTFLLLETCNLLSQLNQTSLADSSGAIIGKHAVKSYFSETDVPLLTEILAGFSSEWKEIAICLKISKSKIKTIEAMRHEPNVALNEVVMSWVECSYDHERAKLPTYSVLVNDLSLSSSGFGRQANKILL